MEMTTPNRLERERLAFRERPGAQDAKPGVMDEPEELEGKAKRQTTK